jgi:hypothetical protein
MSAYGWPVTLVKRKRSELSKDVKHWASIWALILKNTSTQQIGYFVEHALSQSVRPIANQTAADHDVVFARVMIAQAVLEFHERMVRRAVHNAAYLDFKPHVVADSTSSGTKFLATAFFESDLVAPTSVGGNQIVESTFLFDLIESMIGGEFDAEQGLEDVECKEEDDDNNDGAIFVPLTAAQMARLQARSARSGQRMTLLKPVQCLSPDLLGGKPRCLLGDNHKPQQYLLMLSQQVLERSQLKRAQQKEVEGRCSPATRKQQIFVVRSDVNMDRRNKIMAVLGYDESIAHTLSMSKVGKGSSAKVLRLTGEIASVTNSDKVKAFFGTPQSP